MGEEHMTNFLYTDARWTEHFVEVSDPHKEGHHVRFYFERPWVGLTDDERNDCLVSADPCEALAEPEARQLMEDVEAKLKEKNT